MVLGLLQPDNGELLVCNVPVCFGQTRTNRYIGYLPDIPEFYNYMAPMQYLKVCGKVIGLSKAELSKRSEELISLVGLNGIIEILSDEERICGHDAFLNKGKRCHGNAFGNQRFT